MQHRIQVSGGGPGGSSPQSPRPSATQRERSATPGPRAVAASARVAGVADPTSASAPCRSAARASGAPGLDVRSPRAPRAPASLVPGVALAPGAVLEGKYRLVRQLASGSMGSVWCAEHLVLELPVAIKLMRPAPAGDADVPRRFLREARIVCAMRSPHVVQVLDYGVAYDTPYIVMEFLRGESLACRLQRQGRLSPCETLEILRPLADALGRAYQLGVVHRDLKPEHVFIVNEGERELTKLIDFGVAKTEPSDFGISVARRTREGEIVGTPNYMSPEQVRGAPGVDHRSDVWAIGVIAFECLVGYPPFVARNLPGLILQICAQPLPVPSRASAVPRGFDGWFARACARAPEQRFPTVKAALEALAVVCAGISAQGDTSGWAITAIRPSARRRRPDLARLRSAALLVLAVAGVILGLLLPSLVAERRPAFSAPAGGPGPHPVGAAHRAVSSPPPAAPGGSSR